MLFNGPQTTLSTVYDATGRKWKKESTFTVDGQTSSETKIYAGAIEFEQKDITPLRLSSINGHEDGRSVQVYPEGPSAGGDIQSRVEYYHKDHLGNVRLSFSDLDQDGSIFVGSIYDPGNEITLEKHYYPFGMAQTGAWLATVVPDNLYRYNGKEYDEGTGLYDYGARYYDPAIARWGQVDPLAEQRNWVSPYNYVQNNPILRVDPTGMLDDPYYNSKGEEIYDDGKKDGKAYLVTNNNEARRLENGKIGLDDITSSIELPNTAVRAAIGEAVDASNSPSVLDPVGGKHEEGLVWGQSNGDQKIIRSKSGGAPVEEAGVGTPVPLELFTAADPTQQLDILNMRFGAGSLEGTAHIHPSGDHNGLEFKQPPTRPDDLNIHKKNPTTSGYSIVVGAREGTVYFYNGSGTIATFPLDVFRKM